MYGEAKRRVGRQCALQRRGACREKLLFLHVSQVPDLSLCPSQNKNLSLSDSYLPRSYG